MNKIYSGTSKKAVVVKFSGSIPEGFFNPQTQPFRGMCSCHPVGIAHPKSAWEESEYHDDCGLGMDVEFSQGTFYLAS